MLRILCVGIASYATQVSVWFAYDMMFLEGKEVKVPKGDCCFECGHLRESWPTLAISVIREKIDSDPIFKVLWEYAGRRFRKEEPFSGRPHLVRKVVTHGLTAEWPRAFVDEATFTSVLGKDWTTPGLHLKGVTLHDPEGGSKVGVLFRREDPQCFSDPCRYVQNAIQNSDGHWSQALSDGTSRAHPQAAPPSRSTRPRLR